MITRMQTVFHGHDIARVFRLRLVVMAAAMLVSSLIATWCFELMGAVATQLVCGLLILAVGAAGYFICRRIERQRAPRQRPIRVRDSGEQINLEVSCGKRCVLIASDRYTPFPKRRQPWPRHSRPTIPSCRAITAR